MALVYVALALSALAVLPGAQDFIRIFQLESYKRPQFALRLGEDPGHRRALARLWEAAFAAQAVVLLLLALLAPAGTWPALPVWLIVAVFAVVQIVFYVRGRRKPVKKPLKYTTRVIRLNIALALVLLAAHAVLAALQAAVGGAFVPASIPFLLLLMVLEAALVWFLPQLLMLSSILAQPVEDAIKNWYFNDARKKLAGFPDMIKIGITGSYGKTSVKVILATILSEKYKTLGTPSSYNTPMGVTRVIREQLDGSYQVFIAEMGARHVGDIAEMCRLVAPKYGLLTSVGPQHLETFFTLENVAKTKYELIEALPADGMAFFPSDNEICVELYNKTNKPKALFGLEGEGLAMTARDISHGPEGASFTLVGPDGSSVPCHTKLLGRHNVQNILGCAAVAYALGLTLEEIARGVAKAQPVEHRLQLIPTSNGLTVIDDAFNSNPAGARAALEVLRSFPGRKIILTPGLVELGDAEETENETFGREMASVVDIAVLVARNSPAMWRGLVSQGFDEGSIISVGSLSAATAALGALSRSGDVVLFENDLPDHYEQ